MRLPLRCKSDFSISHWNKSLWCLHCGACTTDRIERSENPFTNFDTSLYTPFTHSIFTILGCSSDSLESPQSPHQGHPRASAFSHRLLLLAILKTRDTHHFRTEVWLIRQSSALAPLRPLFCRSQIYICSLASLLALHHHTSNKSRNSILAEQKCPLPLCQLTCRENCRVVDLFDLILNLAEISRTSAQKLRVSIVFKIAVRLQQHLRSINNSESQARQKFNVCIGLNPWLE
jgi:hypothetical protein